MNQVHYVWGRSRSRKIPADFIDFKVFLFIVVIVMSILLTTAFWQTSINSHSLVKILSRSEKNKITLNAIEKHQYGLRKTVSKHLKASFHVQYNHRADLANACVGCPVQLIREVFLRLHFRRRHTFASLWRANSRGDSCVLGVHLSKVCRGLIFCLRKAFIFWKVCWIFVKRTSICVYWIVQSVHLSEVCC